MGFGVHAYCRIEFLQASKWHTELFAGEAATLQCREHLWRVSTCQRLASRHESGCVRSALATSLLRLMVQNRTSPMWLLAFFAFVEMMSNIPGATSGFAQKASPRKPRSRRLTNAWFATVLAAIFREAECLRRYPSLMRVAPNSCSSLVRFCVQGKRTVHREQHSGFASAREVAGWALTPAFRTKSLASPNSRSRNTSSQPTGPRFPVCVDV